MSNLRRCPTCRGHGHNGIRPLVAVTPTYLRCGLCHGAGEVECTQVKSYKSEAQAVFLLRDGTFFETALDREEADTVVMLSYDGRPELLTCLLHHIDSDGVFHYEEQEVR